MKKYFAAVLLCGLFTVHAEELPVGFSLELFGGGTPFFAGDFDLSVDWTKGDVNEFEAMSFSFGAGLTWFPRDPQKAYGFTMMGALHFPTTLRWVFDHQRYTNKRSRPGDDIRAGEFSLGYVVRLFASDSGRFLFPLSVSLRMYYLGLKSDLNTVSTTFHKMIFGFNGTYGAEWHFSPYIYLLGHYTASVDVFSLASREVRTVTTSIAGKIAYYIDDRKEAPHFEFYMAHSFNVGLGFKLDPLFKKLSQTPAQRPTDPPAD
ncbi:MAG: hypothetical protein LBF78_11400 [Treponema sp.]|nr:hypothetical protein [Treponema sp.]